ncbi:MAG: polyamine aminopropyltransferase [Chitinispirillaceae bacterium]|nr:polyamine aminopropyltransferase [Chitinispirillaceae bacterium]
MNDVSLYPESISSLWIQNLINGLSGLTIKAKHAVFCGSSPFQKVEVFDTYSFGRVLCLGGNIVMAELDDTYHEMMVHPAMFIHHAPRQVCCIGGGDGSCLKEILKHPAVEKITVVEIDQLVQETIRSYFPSFAEGFDDPRTELVIDDGYHFLKFNENTYDVILVDSYDPGGPVQSLETSDFHHMVSERLRKEGIAVFQTDSPRIRNYFIQATIRSVSPFFRRIRPYMCSIRSFPDGICSFLACAQQQEVLDHFDQQRYNNFASQCSYYNSDIHIGAFLLPQYLKNIINA